MEGGGGEGTITVSVFTLIRLMGIRMTAGLITLILWSLGVPLRGVTYVAQCFIKGLILGNIRPHSQPKVSGFDSPTLPVNLGGPPPPKL